MSRKIVSQSALENELVGTFGSGREEVARQSAADIVRNFGLPVWSHREPRDNCEAGCFGGWPHESCTMPSSSQQ